MLRALMCRHCVVHGMPSLFDSHPASRKAPHLWFVAYVAPLSLELITTQTTTQSGILAQAHMSLTQVSAPWNPLPWQPANVAVEPASHRMDPCRGLLWSSGERAPTQKEGLQKMCRSTSGCCLRSNAKRARQNCAGDSASSAEAEGTPQSSNARNERDSRNASEVSSAMYCGAEEAAVPYVVSTPTQRFFRRPRWVGGWAGEQGPATRSLCP